jgi:hypothetical protein
MVSLFTGPAPLAEVVRDELQARGVPADLRTEDPLGQIFGSVAAPSAFESVVVTEEDAECHRTAIDEVLAFVSAEADGDEAEPSVKMRKVEATFRDRAGQHCLSPRATAPGR